MNFFDHKDLGNHLLQLCPKVVKHPVYLDSQVEIKEKISKGKTTYWGDPFTLTAAVGGGKLISSPPGYFTPGKEPEYPLNRRLGESQSWARCFGEENISCPKRFPAPECPANSLVPMPTTPPLLSGITVTRAHLHLNKQTIRKRSLGGD